MSVAFDANIIIDLLDKRVKGDQRAKLDNLIAELQKKRTKILIPTPTLTECLVYAGKAREAILQKLSGNSLFQIAPFDKRAAMECAFLLEEALNKGERRQVTNTKFKFDWQIVAIAASHDATIIYSNDADVARYGARANLTVIKTDDLPLPASALQSSIEFTHQE